MADYLTLEDAKIHLNATDDRDDTYITGLLDVVEAAVAGELEENLDDLAIEGDLDPDLVHAMYMLLAHFFQCREPVIIGTSVSEIPLTYKMLILRFKNYTVR